MKRNRKNLVTVDTDMMSLHEKGLGQLEHPESVDIEKIKDGWRGPHAHLTFANADLENDTLTLIDLNMEQHKHYHHIMSESPEFEIIDESPRAMTVALIGSDRGALSAKVHGAIITALAHAGTTITVGNAQSTKEAFKKFNKATKTLEEIVIDDKLLQIPVKNFTLHDRYFDSFVDSEEQRGPGRKKHPNTFHNKVKKRRNKNKSASKSRRNNR